MLATNKVTVAARTYKPPEIEKYRIEFQNLPTQIDANTLANPVRLNGKAALAETNYGKGKIVLFAFRPQHRGQSWATFPFIFNALEK